MDLVFYDSKKDEIFLLSPNIRVQITFNKNRSMKKIKLGIKLRTSRNSNFFLGFLDPNHKM